MTVLPAVTAKPVATLGSPYQGSRGLRAGRLGCTSSPGQWVELCIVRVTGLKMFFFQTAQVQQKIFAPFKKENSTDRQVAFFKTVSVMYTVNSVQCAYCSQ